MPGRQCSPLPGEPQRGAQLALEQGGQFVFPTDVIIGNVEHYDFLRVHLAEAIADMPSMRFFHHANHVRFFDQLDADLILCPRLCPCRRNPHRRTHLRQHHRSRRTAIHIAGTNHQHLLHDDRTATPTPILSAARDLTPDVARSLTSASSTLAYVRTRQASRSTSHVPSAPELSPARSAACSFADPR